MGAQIVAQVFGLGWAKRLSYRACSVLTLMAVTALDQPNPETGAEAGLYFGGRDHLATALREYATREITYRNLKVVLAELVKVGAIERVGMTGRRGHNQVYRLTLYGKPKS